ncbi:hypothetical protein CCR94_19490 [Rhodoblastus sphagnicola]|uniref:Outer membrane protein beta-barrel domain-containing protein n=1 Tax=Rhodoblastus sphagnicola TaxID=333368 RepID=A0A2S6MZ79_9HYPH|nr:outer membrane beta-barrel protein [Rhodoblastus sphagnicola]MBB4198625.1 opacity protein-like surface antigen [Rhodoblastus sphagnicola]PPQ27659.1 hypothetical protein CCR94_19490 [Rhodoblastus sphagnicola]
MRRVTKAAAVATVVLAGGVAQALAADMSLPPMYEPESQPMVEFGSGWYLRGDLGYSSISLPMGSPPGSVSGSSAPSSAASFLSNRTVHDGVLSSSVGVGYQFNQWFRADATFDWRESNTVKVNSYGLNCALDENIYDSATGTTTARLTNNGSCYKTDSTTIKTWTGLVNVYGDLGTWWSVTPYVGGGIGLTNIRAKADEDWYWAYGGAYGGAGHNLYKSTAAGVAVHYGYAGDVGPSQVRTNFSFALMAGLAYDIAPHLKLDVGYRYLNMGSLSVINASGNTVRKTLDAQEVRAGLRWTPDL